MANSHPKKPKRDDNGIPQMPFDDALRKLMRAPPQHRPAKKKDENKKP